MLQSRSINCNDLTAIIASCTVLRFGSVGLVFSSLFFGIVNVGYLYLRVLMLAICLFAETIFEKLEAAVCLIGTVLNRFHHVIQLLLLCFLFVKNDWSTFLAGLSDSVWNSRVILNTCLQAYLKAETATSSRVSSLVGALF